MGTVGRDALLQSELRSYHAPGTCTFDGTANSNQMLMEFMGLHLPGASFVPPGTGLRRALTEYAGRRAVEQDRVHVGAARQGEQDSQGPVRHRHEGDRPVSRL